VTNTNTVIALDAGSGRALVASLLGPHAGAGGQCAVAGKKSQACRWPATVCSRKPTTLHLIALKPLHGPKFLWDTGDGGLPAENTTATRIHARGGKLVVAGTAGGEQGVRWISGCLRPDYRQEVWRSGHSGAGERASETGMAPVSITRRSDWDRSYVRSIKMAVLDPGNGARIQWRYTGRRQSLQRLRYALDVNKAS